jgi:hypothetical protein
MRGEYRNVICCLLPLKSGEYQSVICCLLPPKSGEYRSVICRMLPPMRGEYRNVICCLIPPKSGENRSVISRLLPLISGEYRNVICRVLPPMRIVSVIILIRRSCNQQTGKYNHLKGQFYWWRIPEYAEKTIDLLHVTDKLYHIMFYHEYHQIQGL